MSSSTAKRDRQELSVTEQAIVRYLVLRGSGCVSQISYSIGDTLASVQNACKALLERKLIRTVDDGPPVDEDFSLYRLNYDKLAITKEIERKRSRDKD